MISVLYIDDETGLLEITKRYLERTGMFAVDTAESAQAALEKIRSTQYDAIVCDYQMPGIDGIQFLQSLRASGDFTPFIIFTGKGREEIIIQAFENGADSYLQKGGEPKSQFAELAHKLTRAVELRAAGRARRESEQKLLDIINFLPDATFAIDMEGRVIAWNRAIVEMTGVSEGEILGKGNFEYSLPFYGERRPILIDLALLPNEEIERNYIFVRWENRRLVAESSDARPRGRAVVLWGMATPLYNSQGRLIGAIESIRDITDRKQVEEALRESESRFRELFDNINSGVAVFAAVDDGTDFVFRDFNRAAERIEKIKKEDVIGRRVSDVFPGVREFGLLDVFSRVWRTGQPEHHPISQYKDTRIVGWRENFVSPLPSGEIVSVYDDITARKQSEEALQAIVRSMVGSTGLESLRKITENVSSWLGADCVMIGEIQPDNQRVKVLSMLLDGKEVTGFSYTLRGAPCEQVAESGFRVYPDNVMRLFPESNIPAQLNIRGYIGTPLRDSGGKVTGILCVLSRSSLKTSQTVQEIMDIIAVKAAAEVERIKTESALRKSQYILAEAMDLANLANWEYDVRTGIFTFDDRFYALYGTTAECEGGNQMPAREYAREFVHPEDRGVVAKEVEKAIKTADPHYVSQLEHRIIRRDGEIRHIMVRIGITKDAEGRTTKTHGVNQDITERKRTEDALRSANRQLNLLTGVTRHDIINKITVILGYLEIAEKECRDPALVGYLGKMKSATMAIQSQIEFTRVYQDLGTHEPRWIDMRTVMPRLHAPGTIALDADLQGVSVFADPMLEKVFFNLLDNSIRHGQRVTEILVSYHRSGKDIVVVWEDNGIGIVADEKERIFNWGFGKNTGLGLFLSREILAVTGITIRETGEPGKGVRFEIMVPDGTYRIQPAIDCK